MLRASLSLGLVMEVSIDEAARLLGVSTHTVRRRLRSGELKGKQVANAGGFAWVVFLSDDLQESETSSNGEVGALKALIAHLEAQISAQETELEARRRETQEFLFLIQQLQRSLPAPRSTRPWWRRWWGTGS
jgi:excisionase family DNA binding protein